MSSDPDSNGNSKQTKAFIKERYITGRLPNASYVTGVNVTIDELKEKYGLKRYNQMSKAVNDILNRPVKGPIISKKIHA